MIKIDLIPEKEINFIVRKINELGIKQVNLQYHYSLALLRAVAKTNGINLYNGYYKLVKEKLNA